MSLNVKNSKGRELAELVAGLTGETLTEAATAAFSERLARLEQAVRTPRENAIAMARCAAGPGS
jgi:hypothetical protein